jgi:hypothetical protein
MQLQPVEACLYALNSMNLPRRPDWRPTLWLEVSGMQSELDSISHRFNSFACSPPVLMRFVSCAYLNLLVAAGLTGPTVLKKLMLWQSTALGALPCALQTGQSLWSSTSVHLNSKVVI